jgi:hypothetical protein
VAFQKQQEGSLMVSARSQETHGLSMRHRSLPLFSLLAIWLGIHSFLHGGKNREEL